MRPRHLDHSFAIGTKEVTVGQFRKFLQAHPDLRRDPLALSSQNSTDPERRSRFFGSKGIRLNSSKSPPLTPSRHQLNDRSQ